MYSFFWVLVFFLGYTYIGYGVLIWVLSRTRPSQLSLPVIGENQLPSMTLLIAAYNEAPVIYNKLINSLDLAYKGVLHIVVVSDGSNDATTEICSSFERVTLYHQPLRAGKTAAINRVMPFITTDIVVFNDANTLLGTDALSLLAPHYQSEEVAGVSGEKKILESSETSIQGDGEGFYWRYESLLKKSDARYYSIIGAAGELFSIRTALYKPLPADTILDDFMLSLKLCEQGYRIAYEPGAVVAELPSRSFREEQKRKVRISAGGFQAITRLPGLWRFDKHFRLSFMYLSHRVLRWTVAPVALFVLPFVTIYLVLRDLEPAYLVFLVMQVFFYAAALVAYLLSLQGIRLKGFYVCYYFLFMNVAVIYGFFRFLAGAQSAVWDKAQR